MTGLFGPLSEASATVGGAFGIAFGIIAAVGGVYALMRRYWSLAMVGSALSIVLNPILGILSLIFVSIGKTDFERRHQGLLR